MLNCDVLLKDQGESRVLTGEALRAHEVQQGLVVCNQPEEFALIR